MSDRAAFGVLGGTFDPVHLGHLGVARTVRQRTGIRRILLLPCRLPPHKPETRLTPARHREAMLRLAVRGRAGLEVCRLELETAGISYTIDSMRRLQRREAPAAPVFIMGLDSLRELGDWREYRRLVREFDLIVADRPLSRDAIALAPEVERALVETPPKRDLAWWGEAEPGRGGRVFLLHMDPIPISSSEVRSRVAAGGEPAGLVPPAVARYIHGNCLYRQQEGTR